MVSVQTFSPAFLTPANVLELMDFYLFVHADACISSYTKNSSHKVYNKSLHTQRIAEYKNHNHTTTWGKHGETVGRREAGGKRLTLFRLVCVVCCLLLGFSSLGYWPHIQEKTKPLSPGFNVSLNTHTRNNAHADIQKYVHWNSALCCFCKHNTSPTHSVLLKYSADWEVKLKYE